MLLTLSACSAETGILVSVNRGAADILEFYVGVEQDGHYILDSRASGTRADVSGRNLAITPYELLLEPGAGGALSIRVLVLGKNRGESNSESLGSFAFTQTPQRFIEGEVLRRSVGLNSINSTRWARTTGACRRIAFPAEDRYFLYPSDDLDCDGHGTLKQPPDCADDDAEVFPGAFEYCDNKDTDCDGSYAPARVRCYAIDQNTDCFAGTRDCAEATGGGVSGACTLEGAQVAQAYCVAYNACEALDPLRCARSVSEARYGCTLKMQDALKSCGGGGGFALDAPWRPESCQWRLVQNGGFQVEFLNRETKASLGAATEDCNPQLQVSADAQSPEKGTVIVEFFADGNPGWVRHFEISQLDDSSCESPFLECERL